MRKEQVKQILLCGFFLSGIFYFLWSALFKSMDVTQTQYQAMRTETYNVNNNENINLNIFPSAAYATSRGWGYTNIIFKDRNSFLTFYAARLGFFQQMYSKVIFSDGNFVLLFPLLLTNNKTNVYARTTVETNTKIYKQRMGRLGSFFAFPYLGGSK